MNILLVNSDLAKNRGDRAITEGVIQLIREVYPTANITAISEHDKRDSDWFGIEIFKSDITTLNPYKWLQLGLQAKKADIIFWGGGELLKDYTNKLGLWYWCVKLWWVSLFNKNILGIGQGIGPTDSALSKKLIASVVRRTIRFSVRDSLSYEKLENWGVSEHQIVNATDPAVVKMPETINGSDLQFLQSEGITQEFLDDFIAISPRNWFHYSQGNFLPHRIRRLIVPAKTNDRNLRYIENLRHMLTIVAKKSPNILVVPMHMTEDPDFCRQLVQGMECTANINILASDNVSPKLLRQLLAQASIMIGFRLHSNIIATSGYTPCINYYYVDKGRLYFDQIDQSTQARPIEAVLNDNFSTDFNELLDTTIRNSSDISAEVKKAVEKLRDQSRSAFKTLIG